jgi:hypothetical protein
MLQKQNNTYAFNPKRNFNLKTPCCNRSNKDGKFSSYLGFPEQFGYCHSCGKQTNPQSVYTDHKGNEFIWNFTQNKFEPKVPVIGIHQIITPQECDIRSEKTYIEEKIIWESFWITPENNLLLYLRSKYGNAKVDKAKETYAIGTSKDGGIIFWSINSDLKVQKSKIAYYDNNGKRTQKFAVPYKNADGYYNCLFGAHLIYDKYKGVDIIVLVESEKTAIVGHINLPQYIWVAYGGINGLTNDKLQCLIGHTVVIIPDISENAVSIMYDKIPYMCSLGINASIWDMTDEKSDEQLKIDGLYNCDLEDVFRKITNQ